MGHLGHPGFGAVRPPPTNAPPDPLPQPIPDPMPPAPVPVVPPVPYPAPAPMPCTRTWLQERPWLLPAGSGLLAFLIGLTIGVSAGRRKRSGL